MAKTEKQTTPLPMPSPEELAMQVYSRAKIFFSNGYGEVDRIEPPFGSELIGKVSAELSDRPRTNKDKPNLKKQNSERAAERVIQITSVETNFITDESGARYYPLETVGMIALSAIANELEYATNINKTWRELYTTNPLDRVSKVVDILSEHLGFDIVASLSEGNVVPLGNPGDVK